MNRRLGMLAFWLLSGCVQDPSAAGSPLVVTSRCAISGMGALPGGDFAAGSVTGSDTGATGSWVHTAASGAVVTTTPTWTLCRINGSTLGDFGGDATIDGVPYIFRVSVQDRGTPGAPRLVVGTPTVETLVASRSYAPAGFVDATLPISATFARVTLPAELPVTGGAPGAGAATISFTRRGTLDRVECRYRGDGVSRYLFEGCAGLLGAPPLAAGDVVEVDSLALHVESGAGCGCDDDEDDEGDEHARGEDEEGEGEHGSDDEDDDADAAACVPTVVTVNLDVTPVTVEAPLRDWYRIQVVDPVTGVDALVSEGVLASGDFSVTRL